MAGGVEAPEWSPPAVDGPAPEAAGLARRPLTLDLLDVHCRPAGWFCRGLRHRQQLEPRAAGVRIGPAGAVVLSTAWLILLLAVTAAFVVGVIWPYYVNDLDAVSRRELISGAHDPKDLWPTVGGPAWLIALKLPAAIWPWLLLPPSCFLGVHALRAARRHRYRSAVVLLTAVVVVSFVSAAVLLVGYGSLTKWMLD